MIFQFSLNYTFVGLVDIFKLSIPFFLCRDKSTDVSKQNSGLTYHGNILSYLVTLAIFYSQSILILSLIHPILCLVMMETIFYMYKITP